MHDEPELIDNLRAEGAHGYLLKNANPEEVRKAIERVIHQKSARSASLVKR
jgi:DNA-binding NarL/FixJ family response regulator